MSDWHFWDFTVFKILALHGTTWKMLNACLSWSCVTFFEFLRIFWGFLWCFFYKDALLYCPYYFVTSESTDNEFFTDIFIVLLKLTIVLGYMRMSDDPWGAQLGRSGRSSCPFLKIKKNCPSNGKKCPNFLYPWIKFSFMLSFKRAISCFKST